MTVRAGMLCRVTDSADPRMANFIGGFDEVGQPKPMSVALLRSVAASWPTTSTTPTGVAEILQTSRQLFVHSFYVYEFATVAVAWSLLAVETALRTRLQAGESARYAAMLKRAESEKILTPMMADRLDAGRQIRNGFSHPTGQSVWALGMASGALTTSHEAVGRLFP